MLYILYAQYKPSTAPTNRAMAFLRRLSEQGKEAHVIYFTPDANRAKVEESFPGITIEYLWERDYIDVPVLHYISYFRNLYTLKKRLHEGDKIYVYAKADLMRFFVGMKGIKVYYEITEHPEVHPPYGIAKTWALRDFFTHCKKLDGLFVISKGLKSYFAEQGVSNNKITLFNMIVDDSRFDGIGKQETETKSIVFCGSFKNSIDGVDALIKAFAIVAPQYPNVMLHILARVNRESKDFQVCEKLIEDYSLGSRVSFDGLVPYDEVPQRLKDASILALARPDCLQAKYGFPTKLGEYLLSGNPVVVTSVGEIPLYLADKRSALLAVPDSSEAFAEKLLWALNNPIEAALIGEKGKQVALEQFNYKSEVDKVINRLEL